jgi:hypothetical protein
MACVDYFRAKLEFESAKIIAEAVACIWNLLSDPDPKLVLHIEVYCFLTHNIIPVSALMNNSSYLLREETYKDSLFGDIVCFRIFLGWLRIRKLPKSDHEQVPSTFFSLSFYLRF